MSEAPANPVRFADPPSVEGTVGPHIVLEEAGAAADPVVDVLFAAWLDASGVSPGNCTGASGSVDAGALMDADDPLALVVPVVEPIAPPPDACPCEDGNGDAGTLSGLEATPVVPLIFV